MVNPNQNVDQLDAYIFQRKKKEKAEREKAIGAIQSTLN